jgi:hypothetical protein
VLGVDHILSGFDHLTFVLALRKLHRGWPTWTDQVPAYAIGGAAAFWLIERIAGF